MFFLRIIPNGIYSNVNIPPLLQNEIDSLFNMINKFEIFDRRRGADHLLPVIFTWDIFPS